MTFTHQAARAAEFILSEANGQRSRENIVVAAGSGVVQAGTLIAQVTASNTATATAASDNKGNGTLGSLTATSEAISGDYTVVITEAAVDGGLFTVTGPGGVAVGDGVVGEAFVGGGLTFTIADGATDFEEGDSWTIAVVANKGEWVPYDDDGANDGRQTASGVLYATVDATDSDVQAVAVVRDAEVAASLLSGLDDNGQADLATVGIIVRN